MDKVSGEEDSWEIDLTVTGYYINDYSSVTINVYQPFTPYTKFTDKIDSYWLRYEDLVSDPRKYLNEIFTFHNLEVSQYRIDDVLQRDLKPNFNKGIVGRGSQLSSRHKNTIMHLASYHDNIDFGMIGL